MLTSACLLPFALNRFKKRYSTIFVGINQSLFSKFGLMMKKIRAIVSGKVQGVGFRMYTRTQARQLGVCGYVRNLRDGNVEIIAEGTAAKVDALLEWAKFGPPSAVVNNLEVEVIANNVEEFKGFEIRH